MDAILNDNLRERLPSYRQGFPLLSPSFFPLLLPHGERWGKPFQQFRTGDEERGYSESDTIGLQLLHGGRIRCPFCAMPPLNLPNDLSPPAEEGPLAPVLTPVLMAVATELDLAVQDLFSEEFT